MQCGHVHHRALLADKSAPTDGRMNLFMSIIGPLYASYPTPGRDKSGPYGVWLGGRDSKGGKVAEKSVAKR